MGASSTGFQTAGSSTDLTRLVDQRIYELRNIIGKGVVDNDDEDYQLPLNKFATAAALRIAMYLHGSPNVTDLAVFPLPDGGIQLQTVGVERTVSLTIPPKGNELFGEFASQHVYHRETLSDALGAAHFIATGNAQPELEDCEKLANENPNELFLRQVSPTNAQGNSVSWRAFKLSSKDEGKLSGARI